ncbi:hypothetical protein JY651_47800 [Pyxidicoccus parkwayensis]|uniref:Uncharacterized protein n=1 Tax=Pyxidicoccus parkwayensis TaxID=2813578 RepID=A0ABX7NUZ0_9BACT|nr:hypothetical protein [Pyxidicoccus parkwaysis]QSQ22725.1 hypothetical protein JY651_47800 [Pyxidicoccus parkwaysis]
MEALSPAEVVVRARSLLGLPASDEGSAWHVRRLDGKGAYFLVHVERRVACLDAVSGVLLASGDAVRPPVVIAREAALERASLVGAPTVELVWKPCVATLSMFDPLWSVALGERTVFVDQRGKVWPALPPAGPGGAGR